MTKLLLICVNLLLLLLGVQTSIKETTPTLQKGKASYYGAEFEGRKTANGEKFSNYDYTAAHRKLPFNTYVRVTNLKNNLSITVRINDRGPFVETRIIDLSEAAARRIGSYQHGLASVKVEQLSIIQKTRELDSIFRCEDVLDCLGNPETLNGYAITLWKTKDIIHMLYVANELYLHDDVEKVFIVGNGIGNNRTYELIIPNIPSKTEALKLIDFYERKGFMRPLLFKTKSSS